MKYLLYILLFVALYKILDNTSMYVQTCRYLKKYEEYLKHENDCFHQYAPAVTKLFNAAGLEESYFAVAEPIGYGYIHTATVPHFINLAHKRVDIVSATLRCFDQSKSIFKSRIIETFSPLYWIKLILFLPKHLFQYLGVNADSVFVRGIQLAYWLVAPILIFFRDSICQYIISRFG